MDEKYSNFTLKDLTFEYFKYEENIQKIQIKKMELEKQIDDLYNERCDVYNLIKEKQVEEEKIKKNNLIKYGIKVKLEDNVQLNRDYGMSLSDLKNMK